jgi:hypothetical protein
VFTDHDAVVELHLREVVLIEDVDEGVNVAGDLGRLIGCRHQRHLRGEQRVVVQGDRIARRALSKLENQIGLNTFVFVVAASARETDDVGDGRVHFSRQVECLEFIIRESGRDQESRAQRRLGEEEEGGETHVGISVW